MLEWTVPGVGGVGGGVGVGGAGVGGGVGGVGPSNQSAGSQKPVRL